MRILVVHLCIHQWFQGAHLPLDVPEISQMLSKLVLLGLYKYLLQQLWYVHISVHMNVLQYICAPSTIAAGASTSSYAPTESIAQSSSRVLSLVCIVDEKCLLFCVLRINSGNPHHAIYCFQPRKTFNIDLDHLQHLLNLKLSMTKIAEILCISRPTLYKIVRDYQLVPKQYR